MIVDLAPAFIQVQTSLADHGMAGTQFNIKIGVWDRGVGPQVEYTGEVFMGGGDCVVFGPTMTVDELVAQMRLHCQQHDITPPLPIDPDLQVGTP